MIRKKVVYLAQLSAVGFTGYCFGIYNSRKDGFITENAVTINGRNIRSLPGLPIFGTVSAATPFAEGGLTRDRVCI